MLNKNWKLLLLPPQDLTFERGSSRALGILLRAFEPTFASAVILLDWERGSLEVVFESPELTGGQYNSGTESEGPISPLDARDRFLGRRQCQI